MMMREVNSTHVGFLLHIEGKRVRRQDDGSWETMSDYEVLWSAGKQSETTYKGLLQAMVSQWVSLRP